MKSRKFEGLTVRELKEFVRDLPEKNKHGESYEVWIETTPGVSDIVTAIQTLNRQTEGCDLLFSK